MKRLQRQRKNFSSLRLFILIFTITLELVVFSSVIPTSAQSPKLIPQDSCKSRIIEQAKKDVKNFKEPPTKSVTDLYKLECPTLDRSQIWEIYNTAFQKEKKDWKKLLNSEYGLIGLIILLLGTALGTAFGETLKNGFVSILKLVYNSILNNISGFQIFRYFALKRYRERLKESYEKLKISFRPNKPLNIRDIYVPLKVTGTNDSDLIDAFQAVGKYRRLMIKGSPGSGKTMLLKYITIGYASGDWAKLFKEFQCVPILVELYRFSSNKKLTVEKQLVEALKRNGFPNSERFISQSLKNNKLLLLLDGLDEVSSNERDRVVEQINNFLSTYNQCPVIITCRTAVYKGEFNDFVEQTLEVVEFSDQQIQNFLVSWKPDMPENKSIEQLMQTLHDRPRIMALARNPLMLTIIAYLYTDTNFVLPHSRAEFYREATEILLKKWHEEEQWYRTANKYDWRKKKQILQHLALFFQENANNQGQDRRSVNWRIVESEVKRQLPDLNLSDSDVNPLLTEIVERSSLLLAIDGGERYQFAHLTLQEFFAASNLIQKANYLINHFKSDHDAWRETIKLWCGIADKNTALIREVNTVDPVTAFECLADAQNVDSVLANKIINSFKSRLGIDGNEDRVNHAFASVAADEKRREDVFTFLKETLENTSETEARRKAAANALSLTNLPSAAEVLVGQYSTTAVNIDEGELHQTLYQALIRMGDIAVPKIVDVVNVGSIQVMDTLVDIGTPNALQELVYWLWNENENENKSLCAALLLASLLKNKTLVKVLNSCKIPPNGRKVNSDWLSAWQRRENPDCPNIPIILGQIVYLINKQLFKPVPIVVKQLRISTLDILTVYHICFIQSHEKAQKVFSVDLPEIKNYEEYLMHLFKKSSDTYELWSWLITRNFSPFQVILQHKKYNRTTNSLFQNLIFLKKKAILLMGSLGSEREWIKFLKYILGLELFYFVVMIFIHKTFLISFVKLLHIPGWILGILLGVLIFVIYSRLEDLGLFNFMNMELLLNQRLEIIKELQATDANWYRDLQENTSDELKGLETAWREEKNMNKKLARSHKN